MYAAASYFVKKGAKYQQLAERDARRKKDDDWARTRAQKAKYRQNLARQRADTRGLPSGSEKPRGTSWSYDWGGDPFQSQNKRRRR